MVSRATESADAALTRRGWRSTLNARLEEAGVALRPGEYVVLSLGAVVLAFALGHSSSGRCRACSSPVLSRPALT